MIFDTLGHGEVERQRRALDGTTPPAQARRRTKADQRAPDL